MSQSLLDLGMKAIIAEPWNDTHRLMYADALEESGDAEQAQFIRLHIDMANAKKTCLCLDDRRRRYHEFNCDYKKAVQSLHRHQLSCGLGHPVEELIVSSCRKTFGHTRLICASPRYYLDYDRGFPEKVTCGLYQWLGKHCPYCEGCGKAYRTKSNSVHCSECGGAGYKGGLGLELALAAPIQEVNVVDVFPAYSLSDFYLWRCDTNSSGRQFFIPSTVFRYLADAARYPTVCYYRSEQKARQDLSQALIAWAKRYSRIAQA
jgi:uncharacterized protein (TIGR02996 family)